MGNERTAQREIVALGSAMKELDLKEGSVITMGEARSEKREDRIIHRVPITEWLLSG